MGKVRDLLIISAVYVLAYALGLISFHLSGTFFLQLLYFDLIATLVTFVFSVIFRNSSVYDIYWSLTPQLMADWLFIKSGAFGGWQLLFLLVFNLWALRLSINWITVFTGFSYEDWRYTKYRNENGPFMWFVINFFGIHYVPTILVFAGFLPLFAIVENPLGPWSLIGIAVMLFGIALEYFADRQMHAFLRETTEKVTCKRGLWNYSRHPNYLGEISFWLGVFLAMVVYLPGYWYYGVGFVGMIVLFNVVSIPLMEKRQLARRPDYLSYRKTTSRLLLLPHKRDH